MNYVNKVGSIVELYYKPSMQMYMLTPVEKTALMNGITREHNVAITDAFNAGREMEKGKYKYRTLFNFLSIKT